MIVETSASPGLTGAPASGSEIPVATSATEAVTSDETTTTETTATPHEGTLEVADPTTPSDDDSDEPPAQSSPEQVSRWKKRTQKIERLESQLKTARDEAGQYANLAPVREHLEGIVSGLVAETPDTASVIEAMRQIDEPGTNAVAGRLMLDYEPVYLRDVFGTTREELAAALAAYRGQGEPAYQPAAPQPYGATPSGLPPEVETELGVMDPRAAKFFQELLTTQKALAEQVEAINREKTESTVATKVESYRQQHVYPALVAGVKAWGLEPGSPEADDFVTLVDAAILKTRDAPPTVDASGRLIPSDFDIIERAQAAARDGRHGLASTSAPAVRAVLERHINAIGARHYAHRQQAPLAASRAAEAKARAGEAPPSHVPGGDLQPNAVTAGGTAPTDYGGMPTQTAQRFIEAGYAYVGGKWVKPQ